MVTAGRVDESVQSSRHAAGEPNFDGTRERAVRPTHRPDRSTKQLLLPCKGQMIVQSFAAWTCLDHLLMCIKEAGITIQGVLQLAELFHVLNITFHLLILASRVAFSISLHVGIIHDIGHSEHE